MNQDIATRTFDEEGSFLSGLLNGVQLEFFDAWCHFIAKLMVSNIVIVVIVNDC